MFLEAEKKKKKSNVFSVKAVLLHIQYHASKHKVRYKRDK